MIIHKDNAGIIGCAVRFRPLLVHGQRTQVCGYRWSNVNTSNRKR